MSVWQTSRNLIQPITGCFDLIERKFEDIVLLTYSIENSITLIFFQERYGNIILGECLKSIGLYGFGEEAFIVKIETENVHSSV